MLFDSTLRRELAHSFGANLLVLFTIVITMLLIRTLGLASKGSVNPEQIVLVLTYTVLAQMPMILTIALFVAIIFTLSRMYADSEMFIWFAAGKGLGGFVAPIFRFAWPVLVVIALLEVFAWPWANAQTELLRVRYEQRGDLERVSPGQFIESSGGQRVFFIDRDSNGKHDGRQIFISDTNANGRETIVSARAGHIEWVKEEKFLILEHGQRLEFSAAPSGSDAQTRISEFRTHGIRMDHAATPQLVVDKLKAQSTAHLLKQATAPALGELSWRFGIFLSAFNFVLISIAVSTANPRASRSLNLVFMLCTFVVYYNLINIGINWIASNKFSGWGYMLVVHGSIFLLSLFWLIKQHLNWNIFSPSVLAIFNKKTA